jgi:hypothetical protein
MAYPQEYDITGGIRNWGYLGNSQYGDCDVAAVEHLRMAKATTTQSTWRKVLYRLGFRPPHGPYTIELYTEYLATLGEKPSATTGVDPGGFFQWLKDKQLIIGFAPIVLGADKNASIRQAAYDFNGALITMYLTNDQYNHFFNNKPLSVGPAPADQPNPNLYHAVAVPRWTSLYNIIVSWRQNKSMTLDATQACVQTCWVFLCEEDTYRADFPAKLAALKALPGSVT